MRCYVYSQPYRVSLLFSCHTVYGTVTCSSAIDIDPKDSWIFDRRGTLYSEVGEYDEAIKDLTIAIEILPDQSPSYYNRGLAYSRKGEKENAIRDFNQAIRLDPNDASSHYNRGAVYRSLGNGDRAVTDFIKAAELDPNLVPLLVEQGIITPVSGQE